MLSVNLCLLFGSFCGTARRYLRQHRTILALRLKHRSGSCGTTFALPKCSIMSGCGTRIVLRGKSPSHSATAALLRFAVSATGGAHLCSIQYYLRFWLGICRTSLAVSALRILRYCLNLTAGCKMATPCRAASLRCCYSFYYIICFARVNGYFDDYYAGISSLLFTLFLCRFSFPSFFTSSRHSRSPAFISHPLSQGLSEIKNAGYFHFSATPQQKQRPAICQPLLTLL